jgi:hypothetical protein
MTGGQTLTVAWSAVSVLVLIFLQNVRDEAWIRLGPDSVIAPCKKAYKYSLEDYKYIAQQLLLFIPLTMVTTYVGFFHYECNGWKTIIRVFVEFYLMVLFKDNISMRYGHRWMHTSAGWHHHKGHHFGGKNLRLLLAYHGQQWIDLLLETFSGPILLIVANYFLWGQVSIHLGAWYMIIWADHSAHSCNPFSVAFFNPLLDYVCLHTVAHHLHHSHPGTHLLFVPYEHWIGDYRKDDLELYNKTMETTVDFSFFVSS